MLKISNSTSIDRSGLGPRLLIKFLQDAAGRGELDPWDVDVISVIDSFLDQFDNKVDTSKKINNSYEQDLSETSEAFFAASVLVNLKAQVLESDVFPEDQNSFEDDFEITELPWINNTFDILQLWKNEQY